MAISNANADVTEVNADVTEQPAATLQFHTDLLEFSETAIGDSTSGELILTHTGSKAAGAVVLESLFLDELDEKSFSSNFRGPVSIFPGESYAIEIEFSPIKSGKTVGLSLIHI